MGTSHKDLLVWKKAMNLVFDTYRYTRLFPREETSGLAAQMRRAAVSIPSNIAEGKGRYSRKELLQFLVNARGSLLELEPQIEIASTSATWMKQAKSNSVDKLLRLAAC